MSLKGKTIRSKASGLVGQIVGVEKGELIVTFTRFQEISIPLAKAETLLEMDEETLEELHKEIASSAKDKEVVESKVRTYMDEFEEEEEEEEAEFEDEAPLEMEFDDDE